jgi:DNA repair ATPase RecN
VSRVQQIAGPDRIDELAAMLGGEPVTPTARASAREMLERVESWIAERDQSRPALTTAAT